jgi:pilus assembly protein CpaC
LGVFSARGEEVTVLKGGSLRIPVDAGVRKITVANPSIIDARPADDGRAVLVGGLAEGATDLRIERVQGPELLYRVSVRADLQRMAEEIKELLSDVEGLEVKVVANKVVLKGDIVTKKGYDRVQQVAVGYMGAVMNMTEFDQTPMDVMVEKAIVGDIGADTVKARVMNDTVILEGVVYSEAEAARAMQMAKLRMPKVVNLLRVQQVMIETDVQFIQVNFDTGSNIGFNVLDSISVTASGGYTGGAKGAPSLGYGLSGTGKAKIQALLDNGDGKILAQPHLSTESGGEGSFQSGGSIYFEVAGNVGGTLQKVEYGIILTVKPTMQGKDHILNEVSIEVSLPSAKQQGAFSLDKFETKSKVLCKVGESVILSGLVQALASRFKEKTPLLGDIPLLSIFFSNKTTSKNNKELVLMITPTPVFPETAPAHPASEQTKRLLQQTDVRK